jgi:uncharacterized protein YndB with AHSA1/START domain
MEVAMGIVKIGMIVLAVLAILAAIAWHVPSTVSVSRTFNATPDQIWRLWADAESIRKWWGPKNFTAPVARSDLRPGGRYFLSMRSPTGTISSNTGVYIEVERGKQIVQSLSFADAAGQAISGSSVPLPGRWPDAVTVITRFSAVGEGTEVRVEEQGIPLIMKPLAAMGWVQQFDKIEQLCAPRNGAEHPA